MKIAWPLWECLPTKALVELAQYQWKNYQTRLNVLLYSPHVESLGEIKKLVTEAPHRPKRVV